MSLNGNETIPHTADMGLNPVWHGGSHMAGPQGGGQAGAQGGGHGGGQAGAQDMGLGIAMAGPLVTKPGPTGTTVGGGQAGAGPG